MEAMGRRNSALMVSSIRAAVVKSGLRKARTMLSRRLNSKLTSRSMRAPLGTDPPVGVPRVSRAAWAFTSIPLTMMLPCAAA